MALDGFHQINDYEYKSIEVSNVPQSSIVTQVDKDIDTHLRSSLRNAFPDIGFITEESEERPGPGLNWIIDPIDGTLNYAHQIPLYAISIALWKGNTPLYAHVSLPSQKERIHAIKGQGLFLNNQKCTRTVTNIDPEKAYVSFSMSGANIVRLKAIQAVTNVVSYPRYLGSSVYQSAMVILGRADCAVYLNLSLWDIASVMLFSKEVNLSCKFISEAPDIFNKDVREYKRILVVGEPLLAEKIYQQIKTAFPR